MISFADRLKELRKQKDVTQKHIADSLGIREQTYQKYEYEQNEPNIETLNKLAGYLKLALTIS